MNIPGEEQKVIEIVNPILLPVIQEESKVIIIDILLNINQILYQILGNLTKLELYIQYAFSLIIG